MFWKRSHPQGCFCFSLVSELDLNLTIFSFTGSSKVEQWVGQCFQWEWVNHHMVTWNPGLASSWPWRWGQLCSLGVRFEMSLCWNVQPREKRGKLQLSIRELWRNSLFGVPVLLQFYFSDASWPGWIWMEFEFYNWNMGHRLEAWWSRESCLLDYKIHAQELSVLHCHRLFFEL